MANLEIINTHAFFGTSKPFNVPERIPSVFKDPRISESGTMGHVVIAFDARQNQMVIAEVANNPNFLGSYLMVNPNPDPTIKIPQTFADSPREIERLLDEPNVVGIKTHPPMFQTRIDSPFYYPYYEIAQRLDVPVLMHFSSKGQEFTSVSMLENGVFPRFPRLRVVAAHFGGLRPSFMEEAVGFAEKHRNVHLNTTGMHKTLNPARVDRDTLTRDTVNQGSVDDLQKVGRLFVHAATIVIPDQIVFGDDRPFHSADELLEGLTYRWPIIMLNPVDRKRVDYTNAVNLLGHRLKQTA